MALIQMKTYSAALHTTTGLQVILPTPLVRRAGENGFDCYDTPKKFPVLYLLHGTYGDESDYIRFSRIESYAQAYYLAVVMMDAGNSCYRDIPRCGPEYFRFVTDELPKMMRWLFPISGEREDNFIAGLSMGGNAAFKIGMLYPERFGRVACMSSNCSGWQFAAQRDDTVWSFAYAPGTELTGSEEDLYALARRAKESGKPLPGLYFSVGKQDPFYEENQKFKARLDQLGIEYTYHEQSGGHDWDVWDDELRRILQWLPIQQRDPDKRWF